MKTLDNKEFKEIIQSGHLNLLIGSGCSLEYLTTLNDIEDRMNVEATRESAQKDYYKQINKSTAVLGDSSIIVSINKDLSTFLENDEQKNKYKYNSDSGVMLLVAGAMGADEKEELEKVFTEESDKDKIDWLYKLSSTKNNYDSLLNFWADILSRRSLHIVNKQINIFTTNFDMFMEDSCERLGIPYNDGFTGQINPVFDVSNFNKIQKYKSLQFDNTSDIPLFNIIKLHGSVSWRTKDEKVIYSDGSHIPDDLDGKTGVDFIDGYNKIAVINPNAEKHFETVLDTNYASMLRKFTLELEKENSVLILIGFSLADKHIRNLLYGVMKSNPTLIVVYFSYPPYDESSDNLDEHYNPNLYIISPEDDFSFEKSITYLSQIFSFKDEPTKDEA